jgi:hypothetical protein
MVNLQFAHIVFYVPITVALRSEAWPFFANSRAGIVGSNPTQGTDVCVRLFCFCVLPCVQVAAK